MIEITKTQVYGWESAIRGMRNPLNSWKMSDTIFNPDFPIIGEKDLNLMRKLSKAGSDHGKFLRYITVTLDINAPLYWWKEYDTYKVGTVANSCSTMHKIHDKEFTEDDFSHEYIDDEIMDTIIQELNFLRDAFNRYDNYTNIMEGMDCKPSPRKDIWYGMIQLLPECYNQKRTVLLNYQVLKNMYHSRKNHKLDEWHKFCNWIESLPYAELITNE